MQHLKLIPTLILLLAAPFAAAQECLNVESIRSALASTKKELIKSELTDVKITDALITPEFIAEQVSSLLEPVSILTDLTKYKVSQLECESLQTKIEGLSLTIVAYTPTSLDLVYEKEGLLEAVKVMIDEGILDMIAKMKESAKPSSDIKIERRPGESLEAFSRRSLESVGRELGTSIVNALIEKLSDESARAELVEQSSDQVYYAMANTKLKIIKNSATRYTAISESPLFPASLGSKSGIVKKTQVTVLDNSPIAISPMLTGLRQIDAKNKEKKK
jgi:hypothetical protein